MKGMNLDSVRLGPRLVGGVIATLIAFSGHAQDWDQLTEAQQQVLTDYETELSEFTEQEQKTLALGPDRLLAMNPEVRQQMMTRFSRWQRLPKAERENVRQSSDLEADFIALNRSGKTKEELRMIKDKLRNDAAGDR